MEVVKELAEIGVKDPQEKVKRMRQSLLDAGVAESEVDKLVQRKVREFVSASKRGLKPWRGLCLGVSAMRDILAGLKAGAMAMYQENPEAAIAQGVVRVEGTKVIPLDTRETFGEGRTNPNYGKPLKEVLRRTGVFVVDGDVVVVQGKFDAEPGVEYTFWGQGSGQQKITGAKSFVPVSQKLGAEDLWKRAWDACAKSPLAVDMADLEGVQDNSFVAIVGWVSYSTPMNEGMFAVVTDYESGAEAACFCSGVEVIPEKARVIAVGRKFTTVREGERRIAVDTAALVHDPDSVMDEALSEQLDAILLEE